MDEAENQERHDQEEAQQQMKSNHQHIEWRLLGRPRYQVSEVTLER